MQLFEVTPTLIDATQRYIESAGLKNVAALGPDFVEKFVALYTAAFNGDGATALQTLETFSPEVQRVLVATLAQMVAGATQAVYHLQAFVDRN